MSSRRFHYDEYLLGVKVVSINEITIVMMPARLAALGLLQATAFWDFDVIILVNDVTNKIAYLKLFVDVGIWTHFDSSNISETNVIMTLILQGFDGIFWRAVLV